MPPIPLNYVCTQKCTNSCLFLYTVNSKVFIEVMGLKIFLKTAVVCLCRILLTINGHLTQFKSSTSLYFLALCAHRGTRENLFLLCMGKLLAGVLPAQIYIKETFYITFRETCQRNDPFSQTSTPSLTHHPL